MRLITTIIAMFFGLTVTYGQTKEICGKVFDQEDNSPIAGVIVQIKDSVGNSYQYTITNNKGEYCIRYNVSVAELLRFQCMGYKTQEINISEIQSTNTIYMISQPTQLQDVIIKAPDIEQRSDTLTYYMSKYATAEDKKISDVLKRLPGIKVEDNGQIKYNGEPINKFYIDGSDFMDGRYGIATENINPADVASVEVLENHQSMQVLKGLEFSDQAGLNIKLKEEARHRWISILNGGVGLSPLLYDASAFAMRIAGKWQSMETVRVNNTGWNPASQSTQHIDNRIFGNGYVDMLWDDYIDVGIQSSPIDESRTRDNLSLLANTSNSWHIGEGKDVKFNLTYEGDRLDYLTGYETNYFDDDIPSFIERNQMRTQAHRIGGQWALQVNRPTLFLKDNLYIDADWSNAVSDIGGTLSLSQKSKTPSFSATNDLQLVKRIDNNLLTISSRNRYAYKPHTLLVTDGEEVAQDVENGDFRSVTEARYGWILGRWNIYTRGGVDFNYHDMESNLYGLQLPYAMQNDVNFSLLNAYIAPEASYESYKWRVTLSVPTGYNLHHVRDRKVEGNITDNYVAVTPSLYVRHQISAKMEIAAQLRYSLTPPKASTYISGLLMTDFRNLYMATPITEYGDTRSVTMTFKYRNPITSLFFNFTGKYEWSSNPYMTNQLFLGDYILSALSPMRNDGRNLILNGGISKGLMSGRMTIGLDAGYIHMWDNAMRQNIISPYRLQVLNVQPYLKGHFTNWFSADYRLAYSRNVLDIDDAENSNNDALKQYMTLTFVPHKKWQLTIGGEHYYTRFSSGNSANLILLDASVRWNVSKRVDISLTASNLLNQREYRYVNYGLLSETNYMYSLRGRNIMASIQINL